MSNGNSGIIFYSHHNPKVEEIQPSTCSVKQKKNLKIFGWYFPELFLESDELSHEKEVLIFFCR